MYADLLLKILLLGLIVFYVREATIAYIYIKQGESHHIKVFFWTFMNFLLAIILGYLSVFFIVQYNSLLAFINFWLCAAILFLTSRFM